MELKIDVDKVRTYQAGREYRVVGKRAFPYFKADYKKYIAEIEKQLVKTENNDSPHTAYICEITIFFKIPKTYTNTIKKREFWGKELKIWHNDEYTSRRIALNNVDADNIAKSILDLLEDYGYINNDKNITDLTIKKRWKKLTDNNEKDTIVINIDKTKQLKILKNSLK